MVSIAALAQAQLDAYNAGDLDAFCACYHADVQVFDDLSESLRGAAAFRERYRALFEAGHFGASVSARLVSGAHCVDEERWWRVDPISGARREGQLLVRYTLRDEKIAVVQFLR